VCAGEPDFVPLTVEDVRRSNNHPNRGKRHRFVVSLDGVPVGLAITYADPEWPEKKGFMEGPGVVPEHRRKGVGTALARALMDDLRQQGMEQADISGPDCEATNAFCAKLGFKTVRSYSEMRRSLDSLPTESGRTGPAVLERVEVNDENLATLISISHEAFKEYYDYRPWTLEGVKFLVATSVGQGSPRFLRFARIAGLPVGYIWYGYSPKENAQLGRRTSLIMDLAVLKEHRNQGIAGALMIAGMAHLKSEGMEEVTLSVDDMNSTGAKHLYERLGFTLVHRYLSHLKDL
jgi:mycothiol synthase